MKHRPQIISHRGRAGHDLPENSIEACELALQQGAEALEIDVHFCGSGELVIIHDVYLKRMLNKRALIWTMSLSDLKKFPLQSPSGKKIYIPTLHEFIQHFKGTVPINLDAKVYMPVVGQFAKYIVRAVKQSGYRNQFWISSFNPVFLRTVKHNGREIRTGFLFSHFSSMQRMAEPLWLADYWHPDIEMIDKPFLQLAERQQKSIYTWTVDTEAQLQKLNGHDCIKGIITNRPHKLLSLLG